MDIPSERKERQKELQVLGKAVHEFALDHVFHRISHHEAQAIRGVMEAAPILMRRNFGVSTLLTAYQVELGNQARWSTMRGELSALCLFYSFPIPGRPGGTDPRRGYMNLRLALRQFHGNMHKVVQRLLPPAIPHSPPAGLITRIAYRLPAIREALKHSSDHDSLPSKFTP